MRVPSIQLPAAESKHVEAAGYACVLGYVTISAFYGVFISESLKPGAGWNVFAFLFLSFAAVAGFFTASMFRSRSFASRAQEQWKSLLAVNLATIVLWLGYFLGLADKKISPAMFIAIAAGGAPLYLMVWRYVGGKLTGTKVTTTKKEWCKITLFSIGAVALFGFETLPSKGLALASALAVASGFGFIWLTKSTVKLNEAGWEANEVLAVRFWLLLLVSGTCWLLTAAPAAPEKTAGAMVVDLLVSAGVGQIIALYLLHAGMRLLLDRKKIASLAAALPLMMYAMQFCVPNAAFSKYSLVGICLVVISQLIK